MLSSASGGRRPPVVAIAVLFVLGVAGLPLILTVSWAFAIGVVGVAYAIVALSIARWPPREPAEPVRPGAIALPPAGLPVGMLGVFLAFLAACALIAEVTDAVGLQIALLVAAVIVATIATLRLRSRYVRPPRAG